MAITLDQFRAAVSFPNQGAMSGNGVERIEIQKGILVLSEQSRIQMGLGASSDKSTANIYLRGQLLTAIRDSLSGNPETAEAKAFFERAHKELYGVEKSGNKSVNVADVKKDLKTSTVIDLLNELDQIKMSKPLRGLLKRDPGFKAFWDKLSVDVRDFASKRGTDGERMLNGLHTVYCNLACKDEAQTNEKANKANEANEEALNTFINSLNELATKHKNSQGRLAIKKSFDSGTLSFEPVFVEPESQPEKQEKPQGQLLKNGVQQPEKSENLEKSQVQESKNEVRQQVNTSEKKEVGNQVQKAKDIIDLALNNKEAITKELTSCGLGSKFDKFKQWLEDTKNSSYLEQLVAKRDKNASVLSVLVAAFDVALADGDVKLVENPIVKPVANLQPRETGSLGEMKSGAETGDPRMINDPFYDPNTHKLCKFITYPQVGAGGNHCLFLSALRHANVVPNLKNAKNLRKELNGILQQVKKNINKGGNSPVKVDKGDKHYPTTYSLDGNPITQLFNDELKDILTSTSREQADVAHVALLPNFLKRPVVLVSIKTGQENKQSVEFQTFATDILTGEKYAGDPVYIRYEGTWSEEAKKFTGHFEAMKLDSTEQLEDPKEVFAEKLIPDNIKELYSAIDGYETIKAKLYNSVRSLLLGSDRAIDEAMKKFAEAMSKRQDLLDSLKETMTQALADNDIEDGIDKSVRPFLFETDKEQKWNFLTRLLKSGSK